MNWNLPKQTFLRSDDPEAPPGDCWRCCVAAVLQMPAENVPHFVAHNGGLHYEADTQSWLAERGYTLIQCKARLQFPRMDGQPFSPLPVIVCGPTPRSSRMGQTHAVVYFNNTLVYDPHPSEAGLTAITEEYIIVPSFPFIVTAAAESHTSKIGELRQDAMKVCWQIEKCGASEELTKASEMASALTAKLNELLP